MVVFRTGSTRFSVARSVVFLVRFRLIIVLLLELILATLPLSRSRRIVVILRVVVPVGLTRLESVRVVVFLLRLPRQKFTRAG